MAGTESRYLGVQPFKTSHRHLFFGRDKDIEDLHDFILLEKLVVLFGKSGYGKSSLLNAGIMPRLMDEKQPAPFRFQPVEVRFTHYAEGQSPAPLKTLKRLLRDLPTDPAADFLTDLVEGDTLWLHFKRRQTSANGQYVLLFDQFEEFFSYPAEQQESLRRQLAELLYTEIPQSVRARLDELNPEARRFLAQPMNIKAVFAIRSDRMSQLDSMKDVLPAILHKRYELRPLTPAQAREAIVKPARIENGHFASPPFEYTEAGLQAIIRALSSKSAENTDSSATGIEAFQLQILCAYLEGLVKDGKVPDLDNNGLPDITAAQLPDMGQLYENYYYRKLDELPTEARSKAQRVLEDALLAEDPATGEGRRKSVDRHDLLQMGLSENLLSELEKTYLIRREVNTVGGFSFEISHDTLVLPIQKAKKARQALEEQERLQQEQLEKEKQLAEERRKRRRATGLAVAGLVLTAIALVATFFAFSLADKAKKAQTQAEQAKSAALDSAAVARNQRELAQLAQLQSQRDAAIASQKTVEAERNLKLADNNLALAKREELRAKVALEQVQKEKTATEAQRRLAEDNYRKAQENERVAAEQRDKAEKALLNLEKATVDVVRAILRDGDRYILQLDYTNAWNKLREAAALNAAKIEVGTAMLELVFWHAETGDFKSAKGMLDTASQYLGKALSTDGLDAETTDLLSRKKLFRTAIQQLQLEKFVALMERYYPVESNLVKIGEGNLNRGNYLVSLGSFYMAKTEVTYWQWGLFCTATSVEMDKPGWGSEGNNPAVNLSWYAATNYCNWVGTQMGYAQVYTIEGTNWNAKGFRLPTEAEWEYAARGGPKQQDYAYSGSNEIGEVAWYGDNSGSRTSPVATRKANTLGLFDMSGNVWEWCWDWYADDYNPSAKINPHGPDTGSDRVLRGGSWHGVAEVCRVAYRSDGVPNDAGNNCGFRLARTF